MKTSNKSDELKKIKKGGSTNQVQCTYVEIIKLNVI